MRSRLLLIPVIALALAACGTTGQSPVGSPAASSSGSAAPEPSAGTTTGDIPDNAVFLTYHGASPTFSMQYVEGWQVTPTPDGVVIQDKDSSETVVIAATQADIPGYVASTDLPALQAQAGFNLVKQDTVTLGGSIYVHLAYHLTSPPDSVTGKQLPLTLDRYYVPGSGGLAIVTLATPDGVDNVDAFRTMIESFKWS